MKTASTVLIFFLATTTFAGWSGSGPTGGAVNAVVVAPSDPSIVWAANSARVFRSTDGGSTWSNVSGPLVEVEYLVVHPADANRAWALTGTQETARLYRTTDGGATWINSTDGLPEIRPSALLIDPSNPDTLYIGSHCGPIGFSVGPRPLYHETAGVFKSIDGGVTWKPSFSGLAVLSQCVDEMSIDPLSPWRLFATTALSGQWESYDAGATWERALGARGGRAVVLDARFPFTHYGISSNLAAIAVSQDGGFTWTAVGGKPKETATALSMDPERSRIFLGTVNGLYRSGNGGTVWAKTNLLPLTVNALDFSGVPPVLFAATVDGLVRLLNRGLAAPVRIDLHDASSDVAGLAVDPTDPNVVYAGTRAGYLADVNVQRGRVYRSTNGGASWELFPDDQVIARGDVMSVDGVGTLYAYAAGVLYRRARGDTAWTVVREGVGIHDLAADPKTPGTIFIGGIGTVERSQDGGATWKSVLKTIGVNHVAIDPNDPRWVYAGNQYQFFRSSDGGDTWTNTEPLDRVTGTNAILVAPSKSTVLYRIGSNDGRPEVERSDDRGTTWRPVPIPGNLYPNAIAVDPRNENSVWASATGGLYHTLDGGATTQKIENPILTIYPATILRFDPTGHVLHAAYPGHGVWELTVE